MPLRFASICCLTALIGGCAIAPIAPQATPDPAPEDKLSRPAPRVQDQPASPPIRTELSERQQRMQAQYQVMLGEMAAGRNQPALAAEAFIRALRFQPSLKLAARTTQLALRGGNVPVARQAAEKWLELAPESMEAREVLLRIALNLEEFREAEQQAQDMIEGHAGGPADGFRHVALLLSRAPDHADDMLGLMQRLVRKYPEQAGGHYATALVALRFKNVEMADAAARTAVKMAPENNDYALLLVGVLLESGQLAEAEAKVDSLARKAKGQHQLTEVRLTFARLLLERELRDAARKEFEKLLQADKDNSDASYALGVMAFTDGNLDEAISLFRPLTEDAERSGDAFYQLGRIAEAKREFGKAIEFYEEVKTGGQALEAETRRAAVLTKTGQVDEGRRILRELRQKYPPLGPRMILAEAEMLFEAELLDDALEVYHQALDRTPDDSSLLYGRSLVYERMGNFPAAEADLRSILASNAEDARALNALGYMLTVNTERYDEARELIEGAYAQQPQDAAIIDSMGWVLFKLGQLEEARKWLERAREKLSDPEISAHLGEVLWSLGDRQGARAVWNEALAQDPGHHVLTETVERLTQP